MQEKLQGRLLRQAAAFLIVFGIVLTLSPAARERSLLVDYRWSHWFGVAAWLLAMYIAHRALTRAIPDADPYLLPCAALLTGWGLLTVWRLDPAFGLRQTLWMLLSVGVFAWGLRLAPDLGFLRRYKYVLLACGFLLTALTLVFGTNPSGLGPRLWLGCCGVYFQPSEPLKLLLVGYLSAYFADRSGVRLSFLPLFMPAIVIISVAMSLLIVQRDLGTASIFILLFSLILYLVTGRRRVLLGTVLAMLLAGLIGYFFVSIIRIRVDALFDPWSDPSGRSYQIIQSLLAVANGGIVGRGPGLGNPTLVPVSISDFVFAAVAEETGLLGGLALIGVLALILARGIHAALRAPDRFRRVLAAGITAYLGVQSLLILGGNIRLLPLTGVTLPFVSYGGSSLLTSFVALLLLIRTGAHSDTAPAPLPNPKPYVVLGGSLGLGLAITALTLSWWTVYRGPDLLTRTDNPRRSIADRYVLRGSLLDRHNEPINITTGESGSFVREYRYPLLGSVAGYTHPVYGQAGLEASLDDFLRGLQGNPASLVWWDQLLYGTPPPGLDVRLSLELALQRRADQLLGAHAGAVVLLNARSGELLALASHPTFDPNRLDEEGLELSQDPAAPLLNRTSQGTFLVGTALQPLFQARFGSAAPSEEQTRALFEELGLYNPTQLRMPVGPAPSDDLPDSLRTSPLQVALAAAILSNHGERPAPRIALAVNTLQEGWVILPALGESRNVVPAVAADEAARSFVIVGQGFWEHTGQSAHDKTVTTWFLGGTVPDWQGTPLAVVVALEEDNIHLARQIGRDLLAESSEPQAQGK